MRAKFYEDSFEDVCSNSIHMLEEKVRSYLKRKHKIEEPWIVDSVIGTNKVQLKEAMDIVLFGSFVQRFLESGCWGCETVRFWVLCKSVKQHMIDVFKVPESAINVIPRYELFKLSEDLLEYSDEMTFINGTRLSETKNIEAFLYFVNSLQNDHDLNITPILSGEFDNLSNLYSLKYEEFDFKIRINQLIDELNWKIKPILRHGLGPSEWLHQGDKNPVFISLSTYHCEDFGVSLAQAQELGLPCIVSDWGGHRDAIGENLIKIPAKLLVEESGQNKLLRIKMKYAASIVISKMKMKNKHEAFIDSYREEFVKIDQLDQWRRDFVKQNGFASIHMLREHFNRYVALDESKKYLEQFHKIFGGISEESIDTIVIINDLNEKTQNVLELCEELWLKHNKDKKNIRFIQLNRILKKPNVEKMLNAKKIILSFYSEPMNDFLNILKGYTQNKLVICNEHEINGFVTKTKEEILKDFCER